MTSERPYRPTGVGNDVMTAVVTSGVGDYDKLVLSRVPVPIPGHGELLIEVLAAGMNNTEINTRVGWYGDGGWNQSTPFPLIQGADCCGRAVAAGLHADESIVGRRVLVRSCMRVTDFRSMETRWLGSDLDGAFAQYVVVPATEAFAVDCDWTDAELATIPCAYGTAENMVARAGITGTSTVLITGASGGVGSAAVQLALRRGARVIGTAGAAKHGQLRELGVDEVFGRDDDLLAVVGAGTVDVVIDNVAGDAFPDLLRLLRRGGTYVSSGAIAGPTVELDMRTMYLNDLRLIGCTSWDLSVFPDLVSYIENGEIRPLLAGTFPLGEIARAQEQFLVKAHVGKFVLIPPDLDDSHP
ncbi:MAG: zinc-binding dehydrogenase [Rhodococcus sp. (in: high G+C Gram-positive bacteria)]